MSKLQIALMIGVPLLVAGLTTWINIRIKFASDAAQAMHAAKSDVSRVFAIIFKILRGLMYFGVAISIPWQIFLFPSWPPDRLKLFSIVMGSFLLSFIIIIAWVERLLKIIRQHSEFHAQISEEIKSIKDKIGA